MSTPGDWHLTPAEEDRLRVLRHQDKTQREIEANARGVLSSSDESVRTSEALLAKYGVALPAPPQSQPPRNRSPLPLRTWAEALADAQADSDAPLSLKDFFTSAELESSWRRVAALRADFDAEHRLDALEWCLCGASGLLAALADVFLIQTPRVPGFFGGASTAGGPLANWIRERVNATMSPAEVRRLEREYWVPYDASTSHGLGQQVTGLCPANHRFHSLGHDPILGWIFGVKDILAGTFTAIDKHGKWVQQAAGSGDPLGKVTGLFEAIGRQFGHLHSDVTSSAGLPAPLLPLLQLFQFGKFGKQEYTLGQVAREMYRCGYDFRHFLAMSVSPLLIEVLVRLGYFAKRLSEGYSLLEAIPFEIPSGGPKPKLRTMLFTAHLIASAANAGKVTIGQNLLMVNHPQWVALFRYLVPQLKWVLFEKEVERSRFVQAALDEQWDEVHVQLDATWATCGEAATVG